MYYAHISPDRSRKQSNREHLEGTAKLAGGFAEPFGCREWGYGCGLLHDIGKYSEKFQQRLNGGSITDHATAGARELHVKKNRIAAYCIMGHHSGLPDGGSEADTGGTASYCGRMKKVLENYQIFQNEIIIPDFPTPPLIPLGKGGFSLSFFIRMIFSCLVDADFLDTEYFMKDGKAERDSGQTMDQLFIQLQSHVKAWMENDDLNTVNGMRTSILKACFERGKEEQGLFLLTVPTGGGKTVSSLAFALQHARKHHLSHIIYVIPYTSIIEQNAQIFKDILGKENVLEDHSNVEFDSQEELEAAQLAAENWDKPVVVTTNVQFFESLFSNKSSKCRKLHNVTNSLIIFDEAQMLPVRYLKPCIQAVTELVSNYHSSVVLCTATQPSLNSFFPKQWRIKEICPDVQEKYEFFRRTVIKFIGEIPEQELVQQLLEHRQVLCILNSRKRVQRVYCALDGENAYHLSTLMYPEHRKELLEKVRQRLKVGKPVKLIATCLVEAGVDLDFITVFREMAGVDSMIQAAGRCNREGDHPKEECITKVFKLERDDEIHIPRELELPIAITAEIVRKTEDLTSLTVVEAYFNSLYDCKGDNLDAKGIVAQFEAGARSRLFPFAAISKQFHLIENETAQILIDEKPEAILIAERLERGECSRQLVREAGRYCVNLYRKDMEKMKNAGLIREIGLGFSVLRNIRQYTLTMGLVVSAKRGDALLF